MISSEFMEKTHWMNNLLLPVIFIMAYELYQWWEFGRGGRAHAVVLDSPVSACGKFADQFYSHTVVDLPRCQICERAIRKHHLLPYCPVNLLTPVAASDSPADR